MSFKLFLLIISSLITCNLGGIDAIFTQEVTGISGKVEICNGNLEFNLNLNNLNRDLLPGGQTCLDDGLTYHIHFWPLNATYNEAVGSEACGFANTENHYDPWNACGANSNSKYCIFNNNPFPDPCISTSGYSCDITSTNFPFNCEIGDLSGMYNTVTINNDGNIILTHTNGQSFWGINEQEIETIGGSIVFHCANSGQRAFCSKFETIDNEHNYNYVIQNNNINTQVGAYFDINNNGHYSKIEFFNDGSIEFDIQNVIGFNVNQYTCGELFEISIWDTWNDNDNNFLIGDNCINVVGSQYDPTHQCFGMYSNSQYCQSVNNKLATCGDSTYEYTCTSLLESDRYQCSPSDLSSKYSQYNATRGLSLTISGIQEDFSTFSTLIPKIDTLLGKSIGIHCKGNTPESNKEFITCGKIVTELITTIAPINDSVLPVPVIRKEGDQLTADKWIAILSLIFIPGFIICFVCFLKMRDAKGKNEDYLMNEMVDQGDY